VLLNRGQDNTGAKMITDTLLTAAAIVGLTGKRLSPASSASVDDVGALRLQAGEPILHFLQPFRRMPLPLGYFRNDS
jgi:hypothetical protein